MTKTVLQRRSLRAALSAKRCSHQTHLTPRVKSWITSQVERVMDRLTRVLNGIILFLLEQVIRTTPGQEAVCQLLDQVELEDQVDSSEEEVD
ncbi:putative P' protein [Oak-Vale virus]|uniref:Protein C1 n=1 Tax=Oak-Vale virus TaxID=318852 RepID=D8V090_9RHAB|nr:putative P' protein [Oak-Vale virus]ADG86367.1 protein C1 [Oak-Vale virus]AEJ07646.1 putative P' protein [Oak-Vale virus]AEJ07653.1 putative P' protein [Oak-Vale virus]